MLWCVVLFSVLCVALCSVLCCVLLRSVVLYCVVLCCVVLCFNHYSHDAQMVDMKLQPLFITLILAMMSCSSGKSKA